MSGELLRVDVGDLTFDVRASGPEDGRPVLLLHGFPETSLSWGAVTPLLTGAGLRCYAPDQLGYSPGARPDEVGAYSLPALAQVTTDLMTALDVPVADVVGHDFGANVGWALAASGRGWVDVHPLTHDAEGNRYQAGLDGERYLYPADCFVTGHVLGRPIPCLSVPLQIEWHEGYELRDTDLADLALLRELARRGR